MGVKQMLWLLCHSKLKPPKITRKILSKCDVNIYSLNIYAFEIIIQVQVQVQVNKKLWNYRKVKKKVEKLKKVKKIEQFEKCVWQL